MTSADLVDGLVGKAIEFDGVDDSIQIPSLWTSQPSQFSFDVYLRANQNTSQIRAFTYNDDAIYTLLKLSDASSNEIEFQAYDGSSTNDVNSVSFVTTDSHLYSWSAVEGGNLIGYVDGAAIGQNTVGSNFSATATIDRRIGCGRSLNYLLSGTVSEVRISNIARLADWIKLTNLSLTDQLITYSLFSSFDWNTEKSFKIVPGEGLIGRDWTPADIDTALWLDAADADTIANPSAITQWNDKSGNGRNAATGTTTKPVYDATGFNGKPTVSFSASMMELPEFMDYAEPSIFVVGQSNNTTVLGTFFVDYGSVANKLIYLANSTSTNLRLYARDSSGQLLDAQLAISASNMVVGARVSGTTGVIERNGIEATNTNASYVPTTWEGTNNAPRIGGFNTLTPPTNALNGKISEMIIITRALEDGEFDKIVGYLAWKWGMEANLPSGHAYESAPPKTASEFTGIQLPIVINNGLSGLTAFDASAIFDELIGVESQFVFADSDPISHWTMDNVSGSSLIDEMGNNNGTITNMAQTDGGRFDKYLAGGPITSLARTVVFGDVPFVSVSFWFKKSGASGVTEYFIRHESSDSHIGINTSNNVYLWDGIASSSITAVTIGTTEWYHCVAVNVSENSEIIIFINGVEAIERLIGTLPIFDRIGRGVSSGKYVAHIDNVQVYDYALTETEVAKLYQATTIINKKIALYSGETECPIQIPPGGWDYVNESALLLATIPTLAQDTELYLYYDAEHADNAYVIDVDPMPDAPTDEDELALYNLALADALWSWSSSSGIAAILSVLRQSYDLSMWLFLSKLAQRYDIFKTLISALQQAYGEDFLSVLKQYYNDKSWLLKALHQPYRDKGQLLVALLQMYDDKYRVSTTLRQTYDMRELLLSSLKQIYTSLDPVGFGVLKQRYDVSDIDTLLSKLSQKYSLTPVQIQTVSVPESVTVGSVILPVSGNIQPASGGGIVQLSISYEIDSYCGSFSMQVANAYDWFIIKEKDEVTITVGETTHHGIVTAKSSQESFDKTTFVIEAKSPAVLLDYPYAKKIAEGFEVSGTASDAVAAIAALEGFVVHWHLQSDPPQTNSTFEVVGEYPLQAIRKLANELGGVLNSRPDGSIHIIKRQPVHSNMYEMTPVIAVLDSVKDFETVQTEGDQRSGCNVYSVSSEQTNAGYRLVQENITTNSVIVKAFKTPWSSDKVELVTSELTNVVITNPVPQEHTMERVSDIEVEIVDGEGSVSDPFYGGLTYSYGTRMQLGTVSISEDGKVTTAVVGNSMVKVSYDTKYWKWNVSCPDAETVQFILFTLI